MLTTFPSWHIGPSHVSDEIKEPFAITAPLSSTQSATKACSINELIKHSGVLTWASPKHVHCSVIRRYFKNSLVDVM